MRLPEAPRAFVTGGVSGLGRALAVELGGRRGRVLVGDIDEARARETSDLVRAAGGAAEAIRCDVTQPDDLVRAADEMERLYGGTDLLANNAGVACAGRIGDLPLADWRWVAEINLFGVVHGCHVFAPRMRERRCGFILNVASSAGFVCLPEMAAYNVTKAGVIALTETLAAELRPAGIQVTALCPTFVRTNLMDTFRSPAGGQQRSLADRMFKVSTMSAEAVVRAALRALEAGRTIEVPQVEGKVLRTLKRWFPDLYTRQASWAYRWLAGADARGS